MSIKSRLRQFLFITVRIKKNKILSTCQKVSGKPLLQYPVLLTGHGSIVFKDNVQLGVRQSPNFYSGYSYIEARGHDSKVIIGNNVAINNSFSAVALSTIIIDDNVLIGESCSIIDTDGHFLSPEKRNDQNPPTKQVHIKHNVFIGSNVVILKGVTIGENTIIGNSSVVTKNIPANVIAAGNPARIIRNL